MSAVDSDALTERQRREQGFYDAFVRRHRGKVSFTAVTSEQRRPWNPYWRIHDWARVWLQRPDMRLLDFGCGPGDSALRFARQGYIVDGFDISPGNVHMARTLAEKCSLADRTCFSVQAAERLEYLDAEFDVIVGTDILHHVNIGHAIRECLRVLKPGGHAMFLEPVEAPAFDRLRRSRAGRALFPTTASLDRHVTEDERKLSRADLGTIRRMTVDLELEPFLLLSRLDRFHPFNRLTGWSILERGDQVLFAACPPLRVFAGKVLLRFSRP